MAGSRATPPPRHSMHSSTVARSRGWSGLPDARVIPLHADDPQRLSPSKAARRAGNTGPQPRKQSGSRVRKGSAAPPPPPQPPPADAPPRRPAASLGPGWRRPSPSSSAGSRATMRLTSSASTRS
jgi:hypothetical protein